MRPLSRRPLTQTSHQHGARIVKSRIYRPGPKLISIHPYHHITLHQTLVSATAKDGSSADPTSEQSGSVISPSVHRRLALLGTAVPCLCGLCASNANAAAGRNPWYDDYFATAMRYGMLDYEQSIAPVKSQLFEQLARHLLTRRQPVLPTAAQETTPLHIKGVTSSGSHMETANDGGMNNSASTNSDPASGDMLAGELPSSGRDALRPAKVLELGIGTAPNIPFYTAAIAAVEKQHAEGDGGRNGSEATRGSLDRGSLSVGEEETPGDMAVHGRPRLALQIVGLDPNPAMLRFAAEAAREAGWRLLDGAEGKERKAVEDGSGDVSANDGGLLRSVSGVEEGDGGVCGVTQVEISLVRGTVEALPYGDGEFDAAVVTLVLCSVPSPTAALRELRRVVRPGGVLLLIEHVAAPAERPWLRLAQGVLSPLQQLVADGCHLDRDTGAAVRSAGWGGQLRAFELEGYSLLAPHIAGLLVR